MLKTLFESTRKGSRRTFRPAVEALEGRLAPTLAPTALVASGGGDGTNIMSWVPVAGAVRYNIYSGPSSGQETLDPEGTGLTNPSYIDTGNPNDVPIFYRFTALDAAGHEGARSNEIEMTPFDTMPLVAVNPTIGASTFFEGDNAILRLRRHRLYQPGLQRPGDDHLEQPVGQPSGQLRAVLALQPGARGF
jgi:hypothetical protein